MDFDNFIKETEDMQKEHQSMVESNRDKSEHYKELSHLLKTINQVSDDISSKIDNKKSISVDNFPVSVKTPDVQQVVLELKSLKDEIRKIDIKDTTVYDLLTKITTAIENIPEPKDIVFPEIKIPEYPTDIKVNNLAEIKLDTSNVEKAIKGIKLESKPVINATTDIDALIPHLEALQQAIGAISVVIPENDDTAVLEALSGVKKAITNMVFPVPNYVFPFTDGHKAVQAKVDGDGYLIQSPQHKDTNISLTWSDGKVTGISKVDTDDTETVTLSYNGSGELTNVATVWS